MCFNIQSSSNLINNSSNTLTNNCSNDVNYLDFPFPSGFAMSSNYSKPSKATKTFSKIECVNLAKELESAWDNLKNNASVLQVYFNLL